MPRGSFISAHLLFLSSTKTKGSGSFVRSPIHGAGVQNRFCGPQCFQRSQRFCSAFTPAFLAAPTKSMILTPSIPYIGVNRNEPSDFYPKAHAMERVYKSQFLYPSIFNGSSLSFCDSSRNRLQILQLLRYGFSPIAVIRGKMK